MTAAIAIAQGLAPLSEWDHEPIDAYTTKAGAAGSVAWNVLTHSQGAGPDIARMVGPEGHRRPGPKGMDAEDVWQFVWELVGDAAEIGYVLAQIETSGFDRQWEGAKLRTSDAARAIAALLRIDLIEDGQTFDPEWRTKLDAQWQAERAARKPVAA